MKRPTFPLHLRCMLISIIFLSSAVINLLEAQNKEAELTISLSDQPRIGGSSKIANEFLQFKGFELSVIFKSLNPLASLEIRNSALKGQEFDFTYKGTDKKVILDQLGREIEKKFNANYYEKQVYHEIYEISYLGPLGCEDAGNQRSIKTSSFFDPFSNETWSGKCVGVWEITHMLKNWYNIIAVSGEEKVIPNIKLEKKRFNEFVADAHNIKIDVKVDSELSNAHIVYVIE